MKRNTQRFLAISGVLAGLYIGMKAVAWRKRESDSIDKDNPYIDDEKNDTEPQNFYEGKLKPVFDQVLSFMGLLILSPVYGLISLSVYLDDPGPIFFVQKRVGKDRHFFMLHKYRSMKMSTPHDVPTHMLKDPERYITRVGRILRRTSLDEIPQIWDIFRGKMSVIGPRPALWNQEDLVKERQKYGANAPMPGLTGLAQIKGRDELEIADKAKLDGEYTAILHKGGLAAFMKDVTCFIGTVSNVLKHDGIVEGGTGAIHFSESSNDTQKVCRREMAPVNPSEVGFEDYGFRKKFDIHKAAHKKVLITGAGSYIGESFVKWTKQHYPNIETTAIDMLDGKWREANFKGFDAVFHVAGIAHADVGQVDEETKKKYYAVNTDLAIEVAKTVKAAGVKQFIFMSSMIIYGDSAPFGQQKVIDEMTVPAPANFYGDSKWQADKGVRELQGDRFRVAVLRPPMVYGRGSKGNYPTLAKIARKLPVFPNVKNSRSMLYIDNLCEFVSLLVLSGEGGVYFPQNREYSCTSELVKEIGKVSGKPVRTTKFFNPVIKIAGKFPGKIQGLINKAFGDSVYSQKISQYDGLEYCVSSVAESIQKTEASNAVSDCVRRNKLHILVVSQYFYPETFRINDIVLEWVKRGYKVTILTGIPNYPMGKFYDGYDYRHKRHEYWNGAEIIRIPITPRGSSNLGMAVNYFSFLVSGWLWKTTKNVHADLVFTYEVSPMTQALIGCWYARKHHIPHYLYVTDLWPENVESVTGIHNKAVIEPIQRMSDFIYKNTDHILTSSRSFIKPIQKRGINIDKIEFWPQYAEDFYKPVEKKGDLLPQDGILNLVFAGNVGYAQGLSILVEAAKKLRQEGLVVRINIIGDGRYLTELQKEVRAAKVGSYFHFISRQPAERIPEYLAYADALLITLSKSDVFSITIPAKTQSCMACGRPILVSADGEVQDIVKSARAGLCSDAEDVEGLVSNIKKLLEMETKEKDKFAQNALLYSQENFNKDKLLNRLDELFYRTDIVFGEDREREMENVNI